MKVASHPVVDDRDVKAQLTGERRLETAGLQLDHHVPQLLGMEADQVGVEIIAVDVEMHLASDKGEASAELAEGVDDAVQQGLLELAFRDVSRQLEKSNTYGSFAS